MRRLRLLAEMTFDHGMDLADRDPAGGIAFMRLSGLMNGRAWVLQEGEGS